MINIKKYFRSHLYLDIQSEDKGETSKMGPCWGGTSTTNIIKKTSYQLEFARKLYLMDNNIIGKFSFD